MPAVRPGAVSVPVGAAGELPVGEARAFQAEGRRIAVFHTEEEGFLAVDDRCTHQEAALSDGFLEGCLVECPLHASLFDLRTGVPSGPPATRPVRTYPVAVEAGTVYVEVPGEDRP